MRHLASILFILSTMACVPGNSPLSPDRAVSDPDTVWLYFLNGVASADSVSIRGPSGKLGDAVRFGERWGEDGPCGPSASHCMPIPISRADGVTFEVRANGRTVGLDLGEDLYGFYPHETGTVVFRSGGAEGIDATVVRHPQSISQECNTTFVNALSATSETRAYDLAVEVRRDPVDVGYLDETREPVVTRCGALPTDAPEHEEIARTSLAESFAEGWFVQANCDDRPCLRAGIADEGFTTRIDADGRLSAIPTTADYFGCVASAITIPGDCPSQVLWDDVEVDHKAVEACAAPRSISAASAAPGAITEFVGGAVCAQEIRFRTAGLERVFGPQADEQFGVHGDGSLVGVSLDIPDGSTSFVTLLGRPVNPLVWQWESANTFIDLRSVDEAAQ